LQVGVLRCAFGHQHLYRGEYADKEICLKCGHDKYHKSNKNCKSHGPPHKILRHMPIIPRIQRLFHCKELAMFQGWHASHRSELVVI
jgi:ribosomal protein L37E